MTYTDTAAAAAATDESDPAYLAARLANLREEEADLTAYLTCPPPTDEGDSLYIASHRLFVVRCAIESLES